MKRIVIIIMILAALTARCFGSSEAIDLYTLDLNKTIALLNKDMVKYFNIDRSKVDTKEKRDKFIKSKEGQSLLQNFNEDRRRLLNQTYFIQNHSKIQFDSISHTFSVYWNPRIINPNSNDVHIWNFKTIDKHFIPENYKFMTPVVNESTADAILSCDIESLLIFKFLEKKGSDPNNFYINPISVSFIERSTKDNRDNVLYSYDLSIDNPVTPAKYPYGNRALTLWLSNNIKYPNDVLKIAKPGKVIVKFVIEKDGTVGDVSVLKGLNPELDAEAVRVIKDMPNWIPAKDEDGNPLRSLFTMTVNFNPPNR